MAAALDPVEGQFEVARLPRHPVEPDEGQFELGVAAHAFAPFEHEGAMDVISQGAGHLQEVGLARGQVMGHGRLDQVASHVAVVLAIEVGPGRHLAHRDQGVDIAVGLLGGGDGRHDPIDLLLQEGVPFLAERIGRGLEHLMQVGLVPGRVLAPRLVAPAGCNLVVLDLPFHIGPRMRHGLRPVDRLLGRPESIREPHRCERNRPPVASS